MAKYIAVFEPIGDGSKDRGENSFVLALSDDAIMKKKSSMPMSKTIETFPVSEISDVDYYRSDNQSSNATAGAAAGMLIAGVAGAIVGGLAGSNKKGWYCEFIHNGRKMVYRFYSEREKNVFVKWAEGLGILNQI